MSMSKTNNFSKDDFNIPLPSKPLKLNRNDSEKNKYMELKDLVDNILEHIDDDVCLGSFVESTDFYNEDGTGIVNGKILNRFSNIIKSSNITDHFFKKTIPITTGDIIEDIKREKIHADEINTLFTLKKKDNFDTKVNDLYRQILMRLDKTNIYFSTREKTIIVSLCKIYFTKQQYKKESKRSISKLGTRRKITKAKSMPARIGSLSKSKSILKSKRRKTKSI